MWRGLAVGTAGFDPSLRIVHLDSVGIATGVIVEALECPKSIQNPQKKVLTLQQSHQTLFTPFLRWWCQEFGLRIVL